MALRASPPASRTSTLRAIRALLLLAAAGSLGGCGGGKPGGGTQMMMNQTPTPSDTSAYTVSYRTQVRVPGDGVVMKEQAFADQVAKLDPIEAKRCPVSNSAAFQTASDALGGITWTHPVEILKDLSLPPLYKGKIPQARAVPGLATAAGATDNAAPTAAPTITRPDLVGYQDSTAIYLSQRHGLMAVKTDGPKPVLSCALKLPGQPKYFFYQGNELVLLVNGLPSVTEAALLRFRVSATGFDFVDAVMLDQQSIQDARTFDSTIVIYTNVLTPFMTTGQTNTATPGGGAPSAGSGSGASAGGAAALPAPGPYYYAQTTGVAVTAVQWGAAPLSIAWHEEFLNDPMTEPFAGQDPVMAAQSHKVGDVISTYKIWKPFVSASDRYVVLSRDVNRTLFAGTQTQTYSYCSASHQGAAHSVKTCAPQYEQRPNPDYKPPMNAGGDYDCNGKSLLDCIQEAAPTVSQYIWVRVGQTCSTYTYYDWVCDKTTTDTVSYPTYSSQQSTEFVVYRYDSGDFVKLDQQLYEMGNPGAGATSVATLNFAGRPLEVPGSIDSKNDLQFQHGQFYVLTNQGEQLHTLLLIGNSIAELGTQAAPRKGGVGWSYSGSHTTLFSDTRMMVSRAYSDPANPMNISQWSDVIMFDLTTPEFPAALNQFAMPGSSDQLILAADGVLGPGTVQFTSGGVWRNLEKLTLFNRDDASEIGNFLLGTEFNADFVSSSFGGDDDQRIRLDDGNERLFLPYDGTRNTPQTTFNPTAHRLNITAITPGHLTSEQTFDTVEDVMRTVSTSSAPGAGSALAFGDSSVYALDQTPGSWSLDVVEEYATPLAVYRLSDTNDMHARIDRIGARCQISTFNGSLNAFKPDHLTVGPSIACPEYGTPEAIGHDVVFPESSTGWQIAADGTSITALDDAGVKEALTHVVNQVYCALDPTVEDGTPVPYLDAAPASVSCYPSPQYAGGGVGAPVAAGLTLRE
ncbi:MAG TPA: hypothetical protein VHL80_15130 [Polyangia bacterium]|nr:hypothetical protein [Polyangia bacterium]